MDSLVFLDKELTLYFNSFNNSFFDIFFYNFTSIAIWIPFYLVIAWLIFNRQNAQGIVTLFFIAILIVAADQIASGLFKPLVERLRPSHDGTLQYLVHLVNDRRGGLYSFMSSHAANTFALATFLSLIIRKRFFNFTLFVWAFFNAYSRLYCGLHFIGDLVCGAILGIILAVIAYQIYLHAVLRFFVISHHNKRTLKAGLAEMFGTWQPTVVAWAFWFLTIILFVISKIMLNYNGIAC